MAPPTKPNVLYTHVIPAEIPSPKLRIAGPTNKNVKKPVIMIASNGVVKLSNQLGVILCNFFSMVAKIQDTNNTGSTVP